MVRWAPPCQCDQPPHPKKNPPKIIPKNIPAPPPPLTAIPETHPALCSPLCATSQFDTWRQSANPGETMPTGPHVASPGMHRPRWNGTPAVAGLGVRPARWPPPCRLICARGATHARAAQAAPQRKAGHGQAGLPIFHKNGCTKCRVAVSGRASHRFPGNVVIWSLCPGRRPASCAQAGQVSGRHCTPGRHARQRCASLRHRVNRLPGDPATRRRVAKQAGRFPVSWCWRW